MHNRNKCDFKLSNKLITVYFKHYELFSVTPPSAYSVCFIQKRTLTLHKTFKSEKSENPTYNPYSFHFFLLLWLLPTFFLEQDSRKLEEVVKDKGDEMHRTREKRNMTKMSIWEAEDGKKNNRITSFKGS